MPFEFGELIKYNRQLDMIYITDDGVISQRRIRVLKVNHDVLQAYCYLRGATRTFRSNNILALIPASVQRGVVV